MLEFGFLWRLTLCAKWREIEMWTQLELIHVSGPLQPVIHMFTAVLSKQYSYLYWCLLTWEFPVFTVEIHKAGFKKISLYCISLYVVVIDIFQIILHSVSDRFMIHCIWGEHANLCIRHLRMCLHLIVSFTRQQNTVLVKYCLKQLFILFVFVFSFSSSLSS